MKAFRDRQQEKSKKRDSSSRHAIDIRGLTFRYGDDCAQPLVFDRLELTVPSHSCCLLLGANGVGKSTLLRILAGKHLIAPETVKIFGEDPFSGKLGPKDVTLVGERFPFELDISVKEILAARREADPQRERELLELLAVDPSWRMHRVSNGQRRRVDLLLSFLSGPRLVLLDEVTSDLDILGRQDLLRWLKTQAEAGKLTVVFATHILDGMSSWASHVAFLSPGRLRAMAPLNELPGIGEASKKCAESPLLWLCERWLREDRRGETK